MYRIIIAGSRNFSDYELMEKEVYSFLIGRKKSEIEVVSGTARGADKIGEQLAYKHGMRVKKFYPDWNLHGKKAGFLRNAEMAEYADACIVFMEKDGTKGSQHMIKLAKKKGLELKVILY